MVETKAQLRNVIELAPVAQRFLQQRERAHDIRLDEFAAEPSAVE